MSLPTCPQCGCQLEVKLSFASGPKREPEAPLDDVGVLLQQAEERTLNPWESEFIGQLRERYDQYGTRVRLSEKQRDTLNKIASGSR